MPTATAAEPSFWHKQARRFTVFKLAFAVYWDYYWMRKKANKLQKKMGLTDDEAEENDTIQNAWNAVHLKNAQRLTVKIKELQGFWVKVGQYMSSRADVMPPEYLSELSTLQDAMPPKSFADITATLDEELSTDQRKQIASIDPEPLSTASLAQVHKAQLVENDQPVVLKVQHRGVATLMRQDMANLRIIFQVLAYFEPDFDFEPVVREYSKEVQKELSFVQEAKNMEEIRDLLKEHDIPAIVPRSIPNLVTERVLVMEFCHGFAVRDLKAMDEHNVDRTVLLERICRAWAIQMHVGAAFNADPHYGNILVSTDPKLAVDASVPVLLDFGLTKRLDDQMLVAFARLMHASDEGDVDALIQSFDEMGLKMNRHDPFEDMQAMQRSFRETVPQDQAKQVQSQKTKEFKAKMEALKAEQGLKKHQKLRNPVEAWPAELIFFGRVSNLLRGLCSYLGVTYPYLETMANAARITIRKSIPSSEHAQALVHAASTIDEYGQLKERLQQAVQVLQDEKKLVGLQLCVLSEDMTVVNLAAGVLGSANPRPVTPSTLFNIFSVGKGVLTVGILHLWQEGKIDLDEPIATYWPEFGKRDVTIRHALSHQSGLANALPEDSTLDSLLNWKFMKFFMESATLEEEPGTKTQYHYLTFAWICGGLIEAVTGKPYEEYLESLFSAIPSLNLHVGGLPKSVDSESLAVLSVLRDKEMMERLSAAAKVEEKPEEKKEEEESPAFKKVLAKYRGKEQLMNPTVFNMRKVRDAKLPSANMHSSAESLARLMHNVTLSDESSLLSSQTLTRAMEEQKTKPLKEDEGKEEALLLDDASAYFGLGFQVHEFRDRTGKVIKSFGHAGLGGSLVLSIPDVQLTVALTANQLAKDSAARNALLSIVFDEFGLDAPASVVR